MNYSLNNHYFFSISCSYSKFQYIFFRKFSERYFIVEKNKNFFGPQNVWNNWYPMTHWRNCFYTYKSFTLITYNISFIFMYLLPSGRHSEHYMNARVYQQLSAPCLRNWSLSIQKTTHLYMIALFSIPRLNYRKVYLLETNDIFLKLSNDCNRSKPPQ